MNQAIKVQTGKTQAAALMLCLFLSQAAAFADQADAAPPGSFVDSSAGSAPVSSSSSVSNELGDPSIAPTASELQVQPMLPGPAAFTSSPAINMATPVMSPPQQIPQSSWQAQPQVQPNAQIGQYQQWPQQVAQPQPQAQQQIPQSSWQQTYQPAPSLPPQMAQPTQPVTSQWAQAPVQQPMQAQAPISIQQPMQQAWPQQSMPPAQPQMAGCQMPAPQQAPVSAWPQQVQQPGYPTAQAPIQQEPLSGAVQNSTTAAAPPGSWPAGYPTWNDAKPNDGDTTNSRSKSILGSNPMDSTGSYNPFGGTLPTAGSTGGTIGLPSMGNMGAWMLLGTALGAWLGSRNNNALTGTTSTAAATNPLAAIMGSGSMGLSTNPLAALFAGQMGGMGANPLGGLFGNPMLPVLGGGMGAGAMNPMMGGFNNLGMNPLTSGASRAIIGNQARSFPFTNRSAFSNPFYGRTLNQAFNRGLNQSIYSGLRHVHF